MTQINARLKLMMQPYTPHGDSNVLFADNNVVKAGCNLIPLTGTVTPRYPDKPGEPARCNLIPLTGTVTAAQQTATHTVSDATLYPSRGQ